MKFSVQNCIQQYQKLVTHMMACISLPLLEMLRIPSLVVCAEHPNRDSNCSPIVAVSSLVLLSKLGSRLKDVNMLYFDPIGNPLGRFMRSPWRWFRTCVISLLQLGGVLEGSFCRWVLRQRGVARRMAVLKFINLLQYCSNTCHISHASSCNTYVIYG